MKEIEPVFAGRSCNREYSTERDISADLFICFGVRNVQVQYILFSPLQKKMVIFMVSVMFVSLGYGPLPLCFFSPFPPFSPL